MAAGNGQQPYVVSIPEGVRGRFAPWVEVARTRGVFDAFIADLKLLDSKLSYDPVGWGDPLKELPKARLKLFRGMTSYLFVYYGVHQDRRVVIVSDVVLRTDRPMGLI